MSAVDKKGTSIVENPRWESELWSYIGRSDDEHCPLYNSCRARIKAGLCPYESLGRFRKLLDAREFNSSNYDFITDVTPDRMLRLLGKMADRYLKRGEVKYPPVPNELISLADAKHSTEVRLVSLRAYHGATWHLKDGWVIHLNKDDPPSIRRFTLFHEAFHIIAYPKYHTRLIIRRGANRDRFFEFLAECFAASILMPMIWVRQRWAEVRDLDKMAEIFDVPKAAMYIQLKLQNLV